MFFNPELRRNIWIDFTLHRLILMPLTIFLILYVFDLIGGFQKAANMAFILACFFIFIWGAKSASETVIEEVNNNTWDFQRQSTISPWSMTWGKLIGATLYSWYGALICLLVYFFEESSDKQEIYLLILGGLFTQASTLLLSLQLLPQIRREKNNKSYRYLLGGLLLGFTLTSYTFAAIKIPLQTILWHGITFNMANFAVLSLWIFLGWSILGLQRSFCKELQYQNIPWAWTIFNFFCIVYFSGFVSNQGLLPDVPVLSRVDDIRKLLINASYYIAFFIAQLLTYIALFSDELTIIRYKRWFARISEVNIKESMEQVPWWTISCAFSIIAGLTAVLAQKFSSQLLENYSPTILIFTSTLFLFRDILLIHFCCFGKNPKRALATAILYLFILYVLFPAILSALQASAYLPIFLPSWGQNTALALVSILIQIGIFYVLCTARWRLIEKA